MTIVEKLQEIKLDINKIRSKLREWDLVESNAKLNAVADAVDRIETNFEHDRNYGLYPGDIMYIPKGYVKETKTITGLSDGTAKGIIERTLTVLNDETAEEVGAYAFYKYTGLEEVILPNVKIINGYAFSESENLKTVDFGENLEHIKSCAFYKCTALNNVVLPEGLVDIESSVFGNCSSLTNISLPDSIKNVRSYAFNGSKIILSKMPESLETVGEVAFYNQPRLTFSHIPASVKMIGIRGFDYCTGITELIFDGIPESIGANAFRGCTKLHTVTFNAPLGDKTLTMDASTFTGCTNLKTINCNWPQGTVYNAPWGAPNVETINYNPPVPEVEITPPEGGWPDE